MQSFFIERSRFVSLNLYDGIQETMNRKSKARQLAILSLCYTSLVSQQGDEQHRCPEFIYFYENK